MRFLYVGAGDDPPPRTVFRGLAFERGGEPVEVTDPETIRKLSGNRCYEQVDEDVIDLGTIEVQGEREALRAKLESSGRHVDRRWGLRRLRQEAASGNHG